MISPVHYPAKPDIMRCHPAMHKERLIFSKEAFVLRRRYNQFWDSIAMKFHSSVISKFAIKNDSKDGRLLLQRVDSRICPMTLTKGYSH